MAARTRIPEQLGGIGGFAGLCALPTGMKEPILVSGISMTGALVTFAVGMIGWLILLGTAGRRARVVGWPLAVVAFAAAAISAGTFLFPFAPPWGSIASIFAGFVLGIAFLVKARKAR